MKISELKGKRVAIWGGRTEGTAAVFAIKSRLPELNLVILDESLEKTIPDALKAAAVEVRFGPVTTEVLKEFEVIIRSPGVSIYRDEVLAAKQHGVVFTSGSNIWFAENPELKAICITGSKGKSTTTQLLCYLLNAFGVAAATAGNIGTPLIESLLPQPDIVVYAVELSSYQLSDFIGNPTIAVLLNLTPEHLDWHKTKELYFLDKIRLLTQASKSRIVNSKDPLSVRYTTGLERLSYFNTKDAFHHDATAVYYRRERWVQAKDIQLLGAHNLSNICAALTAVVHYGVTPDKGAVQDALREFKGLNHRLTELGEREGILYVDDTLASNPMATEAALKTFSGRPVTLLVGGSDRGLDQRHFAEMIVRKSPWAVITLPVTGCQLFKHLQTLCSGISSSIVVREATDLNEAVAIARTITPVGGVILLSPGAPSFNTHRNFAEKAEAFAMAAGLLS